MHDLSFKLPTQPRILELHILFILSFKLLSANDHASFLRNLSTEGIIPLLHLTGCQCNKYIRYDVLIIPVCGGVLSP